MKKIKVSEASNIQLNWLVAIALGYSVKLRNWKDITDALDPVEDADIIAFHKERNTLRVSAEQIPGSGWFPNPKYTTNWSQMGPIIERERITLNYDSMDGTGPNIAYYLTTLFDDAIEGWSQYGDTPLIAAARCYVSNKLGTEVEVPEELL